MPTGENTHQESHSSQGGKNTSGRKGLLIFHFKHNETVTVFLQRKMVIDYKYFWQKWSFGVNGLKSENTLHTIQL